jgi:hypothetical protein
VFWDVGGGLPHGLSAGRARLVDGRAGRAVHKCCVVVRRVCAADAWVQGRQHCRGVHLCGRLLHAHGCAARSS